MKEKYSFHISSNIIQPWHHAKAVCVKFGCHFFADDVDEEVVAVRLRVDAVDGDEEFCPSVSVVVPVAGSDSSGSLSTVET